MADQTGYPVLAPAAPPLVGREREQAALRDALAAALAGRGSLVLIGGEAGIGKTALAEALLAEAAAQGALVLVGRCYDLSETPPYGPWAEALRPRAPRRRPARPARGGPAPRARRRGAGEPGGASSRRVRGLPGRARRAAARSSCCWTTCTGPTPPPSTCCASSARGLADLPAPRSSPPTAPTRSARDHPLAALLPAPGARGPRRRGSTCARSTRRPSARSSRRATPWLRPTGSGWWPTWPGAPRATRSSWASCCARSRARGCCAGTATGWALGRPGRAPVPALLRQVIDGRLARLDERKPAAARGRGGHRAGGAARCLGACRGGRGRRGAADHGAAGWRRGCWCETPDGDAVRFAHALIREALYAGLVGARRRRLHRRIGEALAAAAEPRPGRGGLPFPPGRATRARSRGWCAAGERAHRAYAWLTAADRFAAALDARGGGRRGPRERGWLLYHVATLRARRHRCVRRQPGRGGAAGAGGRRPGPRRPRRVLARHPALHHRRRRAGLRDMEAGVRGARAP